MEINNILSTFKAESTQTLDQLKRISLEEDNLLNQLDFLENILDNYLRYSDLHLDNPESDSSIYKTQAELQVMQKTITLSLSELENRVKISMLDDIELENHLENLTIFDRNTNLTQLLSDFYSSIKNLKHLQSKVQFDLTQTKSRLGIES